MREKKWSISSEIALTIYILWITVMVAIYLYANGRNVIMETPEYWDYLFFAAVFVLSIIPIWIYIKRIFKLVKWLYSLIRR
jgi:hypothetical protein